MAGGKKMKSVIINGKTYLVDEKTEKSIKNIRRKSRKPPENFEKLKKMFQKDGG